MGRPRRTPPLPRWPLPQSIKGRLAALLLTLLLPIILSEVVIHYRELQRARADEFQANVEVARAVATTLDAYVRDVVGREFVMGVALTSPRPLPPEEASVFLRVSADQHPTIKRFTWLDPGGRAIASSDPEAVGLDISGGEHFRRIDQGADWAVTDLVQARVGGEPAFFIARGVRDEQGALLGVLVATVDVERLDAVLPLERGEGGAIAAADRQGRLVYRYPGVQATWEQRDVLSWQPFVRAALNGDEATDVVTSRLDGQRRMAAAVPVRSIGWVAEASRPEAEVMAPLYGDFAYGVGLPLLVSVGALLAALLFARGITVPLSRLRDHARAFERGNLAQGSALTGPREIAELDAAFRQMAEAVRHREVRLAEAERRYRTLFEKALDGSLVVAEDARIVDANPQASTVTGYSREELLSLSLPDLARPEDREECRRGLARLRQDGELRGEFQLVRKDGTPFHVDVSAVRVGPSSYQAALRDVTTRKEAETERERLLAELDATISSIPDALLIYDVEGRIVRMNPSAVRLLGYTAEKASMRLAERLSSLHMQTAEGAPFPLEETPLALALQGKTVHGVIACLHPSPERAVWGSVGAAPVYGAGGRLLGAVVVFTDVTALHEAQEEREVFARTISHDLRGPLGIILGQAQLAGLSQGQA